MRATKIYPSQEELRARFVYDKGVLRLRKNGREVGTLLNTGYSHVGYQNKVYLLHRLIYIYHYGDIPDGLVIDHIDGDKTNNLVPNLQAITQTNNVRKQKVHKANRTGCRGCSELHNGKFKVQVGGGGPKHNRYIGTFDTLSEAAQAYNKVALETFGEFAVLNPV